MRDRLTHVKRWSAAAIALATLVAGCSASLSGPTTGAPEYSPGKVNPLVAELSISRPPAVGEEATITLRLSAPVDIPRCHAELLFRRRSGLLVPVERVLVSGAAEWDFELKAAAPAVLTAQVKFAEAGDWRVEANASSPDSIDGRPVECAEVVLLTIGTDKSHLGWEESPGSGECCPQ